MDTLEVPVRALLYACIAATAFSVSHVFAQAVDLNQAAQDLDPSIVNTLGQEGLEKIGSGGLGALGQNPTSEGTLRNLQDEFMSSGSLEVRTPEVIDPDRIDVTIMRSVDRTIDCVEIDAKSPELTRVSVGGIDLLLDSCVRRTGAPNPSQFPSGLEFVGVKGRACVQRVMGGRCDPPGLAPQDWTEVTILHGGGPVVVDSQFDSGTYLQVECFAPDYSSGSSFMCRLFGKEMASVGTGRASYEADAAAAQQKLSGLADADSLSEIAASDAYSSLKYDSKVTSSQDCLINMMGEIDAESGKIPLCDGSGEMISLSTDCKSETTCDQTETVVQEYTRRCSVQNFDVTTLRRYTYFGGTVKETRAYNVRDCSRLFISDGFENAQIEPVDLCDNPLVPTSFPDSTIDLVSTLPSKGFGRVIFYGSDIPYTPRKREFRVGLSLGLSDAEALSCNRSAPRDIELGVALSGYVYKSDNNTLQYVTPLPEDRPVYYAIGNVYSYDGYFRFSRIDVKAPAISRLGVEYGGDAGIFKIESDYISDFVVGETSVDNGSSLLIKYKSLATLTPGGNGMSEPVFFGLKRLGWKVARKDGSSEWGLYNSFPLIFKSGSQYYLNPYLFRSVDLYALVSVQEGEKLRVYLLRGERMDFASFYVHWVTGVGSGAWKASFLNNGNFAGKNVVEAYASILTDDGALYRFPKSDCRYSSNDRFYNCTRLYDHKTWKGKKLSLMDMLTGGLNPETVKAFIESGNADVVYDLDIDTLALPRLRNVKYTEKSTCPQ